MTFSETETVEYNLRPHTLTAKVFRLNGKLSRNFSSELKHGPNIFASEQLYFLKSRFLCEH